MLVILISCTCIFFLSQVPGVGTARSTVPIRTFELPTETLGTLRAKIELQKQAMRATSAKASSLLSSRNPTTSSAATVATTAGFYPLPDGMQIGVFYGYPIYRTCVHVCMLWYANIAFIWYYGTCNYQVVFFFELGKDAVCE